MEKTIATVETTPNAGTFSADTLLARTEKLEHDAKWEKSLARAVILFALTYLLALGILLACGQPKPYVLALIPCTATISGQILKYVLSAVKRGRKTS